MYDSPTVSLFYSLYPFTALKLFRETQGDRIRRRQLFHFTVLSVVKTGKNRKPDKLMRVHFLGRPLASEDGSQSHKVATVTIYVIQANRSDQTQLKNVF